MCLLCEKYSNKTEILMENETCFVIKDESPVSFGHVLVVTKDCKQDFFSLTYKEHEDMMMLLKNYKAILDKTIHPDGYNVGFNIGVWGGQTILHCNAELIPRFAGDVAITDLKGGIRNFKEKMKGVS